MKKFVRKTKLRMHEGAVHLLDEVAGQVLRKDQVRGFLVCLDISEVVNHVDRGLCDSLHVIRCSVAFFV
jgi:hypothetical protein